MANPQRLPHQRQRRGETCGGDAILQTDDRQLPFEAVNDSLAYNKHMPRHDVESA